jgi:hypothetical protein
MGFAGLHNRYLRPAGAWGVREPWRRRDTLLLAAFGLAAFATRAALRGTDLYSWDSGLLAGGIVDYSFAAAHPHPPFYPLTIALGKLLAPLTGPIQALAWLSVGASTVLVAGTYAVGRQLANEWTAAGAALLVLLSPTALFNGIAPLSYALEGASSVGLAWVAWRCRTAPSPRRAAWLGLAFSVAVGIRPSALFILAPLALWAVVRERRLLPWALGSALLSGLAWGIPMLVAGGGLRMFLAVNGYQSRFVVFAHTIFQEGWKVVPENLGRLGSYVPWELGFLALVALLAVVAAGLLRAHLPRRPAGSFLAAWLLPPLLFYTLLYAGWPIFPTGYVMPLVPAVAIACALVLRAAWDGLRASGAPRPAVVGACAAVALLGLSPLGWAADWPAAVRPMRDAEAWSRSLDGLEQALPPNGTALLTFYEWGWAELHHPAYLSWVAVPIWNATGQVKVQVAQSQGGVADRPYYANALDPAPKAPHPIPAAIRRVAVLEGHPLDAGADLVRPGIPTSTVTLPSGRAVRVFDTAGLPSIEAAMPWFDARGDAL